MERLHKYMAECNVASRRHSEEIILAGRVKVNGELVTSLGFKVSDSDIVTVDDVRISKASEKKYYVINKPRGIVSTLSDPEGRKTIISILPKELQEQRLFPVGRLDYDTKGVMLLTNDGDFMNTLVGPKSHTEKEYLVRVKGIPTKDDIKKLEKGVSINDEKGKFTTLPAKAFVKSVDNKNGSSLLSITIYEGKYHQVKRMINAIGYDAVRLTRIRFGRITIDGLKEGEVRELKIHEVRALIGDSKQKVEGKKKVDGRSIKF